MPGDIRNDLFLTIERGEYERGGKSTAKNIEVSVCLFDSNGKALNQCLWSASGESCLNYRSVVIYHNNSPYWFENLR
jgi:dedicator of cytokinesis protein 3